ncbi:MAG: anaerobic ribonucleoside-triphosphate reductase activating protein [Candidatus Woesearchaeota archaeon]
MKDAIVIKGYQKTSFVDFPGHICATIFTAGCNMRCPYCHNAHLATGGKGIPAISVDQILSDLEKRKHNIEALCISGGEPTIHKGLIDFIRSVKTLGLKVKLDTNGTNPDIIETLLSENLLDFIAMDVKQTLSKYQKASILPVDSAALAKTISVLKESGVPYEFRLTVVPEITSKEDVVLIAKELSGAKTFALQQFVPTNAMFDCSLHDRFSSEDLYVLKDSIKEHFEQVLVRV